MKRALGELNNIFRDKFNKIFITAVNVRMSDSFYHITESSELD